MRTTGTTLFAALLVLLAAAPAQAQRGECENVTIRQLNTVPQANISQLMALGPQATANDVHELLTNEYVDAECVSVEAVVLSDPRYSGLASWVPAESRPGRVHVFVRDVAAATDGVEGMTIQIVDPTGAVMPLRVGDIIEIEATLDIFGNPPQRTWQLAPLDFESITLIGGVDDDDPILDPVTVSTSDFNMVVGEQAGEPVVQANWASFSDFNGQYIRIEGAQITNSEQAERPNWALASTGEEVMTRTASYDVSLRYRNDRVGSYPEDAFFVRPADDPFIAPPPGAIVDVQAFLTFGTFDAFEIGSPPRALFFFSPITDEDLDIIESPPLIVVHSLTEVPDGPIDVSATVVQTEDPIAVVDLVYEFSGGESGTIAMSFEGDDTFTATIPVSAGQDTEFVSFHVVAADTEGLTNISRTISTRILMDGITEIAHIQETASGGFGASPFAGLTAEMDLEVVVMSDVEASGIITLQDGTDPWSGIHVFRSAQLIALLEKGMTLNITSATIEEDFNMTTLTIPADGYTVTGSAEPFPHVLLNTADVANVDDAEQYEGMALRFEDVIITANNADGTSNFGEWYFSSDGSTANQIRGDDESFLIPFGSDMFTDGQELDFIQGVWAYAFNNFKLWPLVPDDIDTPISTEVGVSAEMTTIRSVYPNPVASSATIEFMMAGDHHATIEVFDVTGRRVMTLVDGMQAAGVHQVSIDAGALASGMYFVRLTAGDAVEAGRFVVTR